MCNLSGLVISTGEKRELIILLFEPRCEKSGLRGLRPGPKMARGLKFRIQVEEGLCYQCSENKGPDQLRGYREADLRLCFRICKKPVFSRRGSFRTCHFVFLFR